MQVRKEQIRQVQQVDSYIDACKRMESIQAEDKRQQREEIETARSWDNMPAFGIVEVARV